jgi:hypothetical protein
MKLFSPPSPKKQQPKSNRKKNIKIFIFLTKQLYQKNAHTLREDERFKDKLSNIILKRDNRK